MSSASSTTETIDLYYQRLQDRDRDGLLVLLADDVVVHYYGPAGLLPWIGDFHGKQGFLDFFDIIAKYLDIVEVSTLDRIADDRKLVVQCRGTWRVRKTGKNVNGNMVNVFTVRDGKIAAYEVYNDTAAFAEGMR